MTPNASQTGPFKVGDRLFDKYEVRGLLGKGGHAFVYDCFNAFLAEEVAIKIIPNPPHKGNQLYNRARGEAQLLYRLNHPNVVKVTDGGELDGMAYIVMEKLEGVTLREFLRKHKRLTPVEALSIALQVADALEAAHAMNVIHRDLKPDNIFLLAGNRIKVLDFGIAKFLEGGYQTTQKDLIHGTAPYMSPEQAQGHGVTFASDIFQLGTILYEMMAGICPCLVGVEEQPTPQVMIAMQIAKLPPRLRTLVRAVPDYVDLLVWRAIAKAAQQRYPTMRAFTDAIQEALERLKVELPPKELMMRVVRLPEKRPTGSPKVEPRLVPQTTPIALVTSQSFRNAATLIASSDTAPQSLPPESLPPPRASQPARSSNADIRPAAPAWVPGTNPGSAPLNKDVDAEMSAHSASGQGPDLRSARDVLLRAVLVGVAIALPACLVVILSKRQHAAPAATVSAQLAQTAPAAEPPPTPPSPARPLEIAPQQAAASADPVVPAMPAVPSAQNSAHATPQGTARGASRAVSAAPSLKLSAMPGSGLPSSGLDSPFDPKPVSNAPKAAAQKPAASSQPDHKPIKPIF
ncbi:MAG TPA: serine/threonine-protein kinase [Polyangiaceae bacterium]|nr:serine/threonine-protein kinase [Polyangiaceae bacterium]